ncbi:MAG: winged helix DNA-binding domain-containing protein [Chloroflexi bacterium]|nr:winged helix DNA-binding domain-containing protein [Chloroflexota bacterium]
MTDKTPAMAFKRLAQQRLTQNPFETAAEAVRWLGAVQAQEYQDAKWSLGMRMAGATDEVVERAIDEGTILRTHAMRPTWHFVAPEDIRWLQALTGPRVQRQNGPIYRQNGLDEALRERCTEIMAEALAGQRNLTRAELRETLAAAGIEASGQRLAYIVMHAELEGVICSGLRRGKQITYVLLEERAPPAPALAREEALVELTRRFFTGHGPATERDMSWWSGLTLTDVRRGLELAGAEMAYEEEDGKRYWFSTAHPPAAVPTDEAFLLPTYDEFLIGYAAADRGRVTGVHEPEAMVFFSTVVIGGQVRGTWRRTFQKGRVNVEVAPFRPFAAGEREAVAAAVERYAAFLGMAAALQFL